MMALPKLRVLRFGKRQAATNGSVLFASGWIRTLEDGPDATLKGYLSNFSGRSLEATLAINQWVDGGRKRILAQETVNIPAQSVGFVDTPTPSGAFIEFEFTVPADRVADIVPSAGDVQFFLADGGILPHTVVSPNDFAKIDMTAVQRQRSPRTRQTTHTLSTGTIDMPQGVAAARPETRIFLSSFVDHEVLVPVTVEAITEQSTRKRRVFAETVAVPANGSSELLLDNVEGRIVEINVALPSPSIAPSLEVRQRFLADDSIQPILFVPAGGFVPVTTRSR